MSNLSKLFVSVSATDCDSFISKYVTDSESRQTTYDEKIVFLEKSREIFTHGKLYGLNNSSDVAALETLIGTLPNKTEAVKFTQAEIDAAQEGDDAYGKTTDDVKTPATTYSSVVEYIKETTRKAVSAGVSVDTTGFKIDSSATYNLYQDELGKISIVRYDPITLSIKGLSNVEIDSTVAAKTITPTVGGTNKSTAAITWSVSGGTLDKTSTTGSATVSVSGITSPTACTVTASATDGTTTASGKTTTLSFQARIMWGWSADELTDVEITSTNVSGYDYLVQSSRSLGSTGKSLTIGDGGGYIYYAAPESYQVATNKMFVNSGTAKAPLGGGWMEVGEFTKYTSKETTYKLYRTTNKQAAGKYRIDVD